MDGELLYPIPKHGACVHPRGCELQGAVVHPDVLQKVAHSWGGAAEQVCQWLGRRLEWRQADLATATAEREPPLCCELTLPEKGMAVRALLLHAPQVQGGARGCWLGLPCCHTECVMEGGAVSASAPAPAPAKSLALPPASVVAPASALHSCAHQVSSCCGHCWLAAHPSSLAVSSLAGRLAESEVSGSCPY